MRNANHHTLRIKIGRRDNLRIAVVIGSDFKTRLHKKVACLFAHGGRTAHADKHDFSCGTQSGDRALQAIAIKQTLRALHIRGKQHHEIAACGDERVSLVDFKRNIRKRGAASDTLGKRELHIWVALIAKRTAHTADRCFAHPDKACEFCDRIIEPASRMFPEVIGDDSFRFSEIAVTFLDAVNEFIGRALRGIHRKKSPESSNSL